MNTVTTATEAATYADRHPLDLPCDDTHAIAKAIEMPLTILGLAERFALHYGDHVACVGGSWFVAFSAYDWEDDATVGLEYATTAALSVVRSLSTVEFSAIDQHPRGGLSLAVKHRERAAKFEDMHGVAGKVLDMARHLVPHHREGWTA